MASRTLRIPVSFARKDAPSASHTLEGRLSIGARAEPGTLALVAPPHPLYGGSIGNPVVRAMESAYQAAGRATLAFNFRGTGDSSGEPSGDLADALTDYRAAAQVVPDRAVRWLSGYSFGSCAALSVAIELALPSVLLVAPPLAFLDPALLTQYRGQVCVAVGDADDYAPLDDLRALFAPVHELKLEVLEGVDHFFSGSQVQRLSAVLPRLLG